MSISHQLAKQATISKSAAGDCIHLGSCCWVLPAALPGQQLCCRHGSLAVCAHHIANKA